MILRRIAAHLKQQQWTGVFIELVIVILGVFIGLQAQEWTQDHRDHAAEAVYLRSLAKDFDSIEASVQIQIDLEATNARFVNQALDRIDAPPSPDKRLRLGMLLGQLQVRRTLKFDSPTFQELQSSGNLGLIRDPVLRNSIVSYFFLTQRLQVGLDKNNEFLLDTGFNRFLRDSGVELAVWDSAFMHEPPSMQAFGDEYVQLMHKRYDERIAVPANEVLGSPSGDPFWGHLRQQLNWRASAATYNETIAWSLKKMTADVKAQTLSRLTESK